MAELTIEFDPLTGVPSFVDARGRQEGRRITIMDHPQVERVFAGRVEVRRSTFLQEPATTWTARDIMKLEHRLEHTTDPDERAAIIRCLNEAKAPPLPDHNALRTNE